MFTGAHSCKIKNEKLKIGLLIENSLIPWCLIVLLTDVNFIKLNTKIRCSTIIHRVIPTVTASPVGAWQSIFLGDHSTSISIGFPVMSRLDRHGRYRHCEASATTCNKLNHPSTRRIKYICQLLNNIVNLINRIVFTKRKTNSRSYRARV